MGQSPVDFTFHTIKTLDLMAIARMAPDEQSETMSRYTKLRDDLAARVELLRAAAQKSGVRDCRLLGQLSKALRKHRSAELAIERLQGAIAQAEQGKEWSTTPEKEH